METVSRNKGRPRVFDDAELAAATRMIAGGVSPTGPKSRRQTQNRLYALRAMDRLGLLEDGELREALADRPALDWLVSEEGARWAILAELGRIRDSGAFDTAVRWVLEYRPRTKEAVAEIRRFRTGKSNPPDTRELAGEVVRAVDDYATRHPGITSDQALEALRLAIRTVASDRLARAREDRSPGAAEPRWVPDHPTS
jgi:hypothetical protein